MAEAQPYLLIVLGVVLTALATATGWLVNRAAKSFDRAGLKVEAAGDALVAHDAKDEVRFALLEQTSQANAVIAAASIAAVKDDVSELKASVSTIHRRLDRALEGNPEIRR